LWPRGNTTPETTLLSGYGVDTLRWADNVRGTGSSCCPGEFQRGLTRRAREQRRAGGTSPTLLPARAWPGTPSPVQSYTRFYTRHGLIRVSRTDDRARPRLVTHPGRAASFLTAFSPISDGFRGGFPPSPRSGANPSPRAARCLTNKGWPGGLRSRISPHSPKPLIDC